MIVLGAGLTFATSLFFLFTIVASASYGPNGKENGNIADGKYMVFKPSLILRILLWFDIPIVYLCYLFIISVVELIAAYSTATWYFSRKKKEAIVIFLLKLFFSFLRVRLCQQQYGIILELLPN